jgi:hypothetical protein
MWARASLFLQVVLLVDFLGRQREAVGYSSN